MPDKIYNIYIGKFENTSESKKTLKLLNSFGIKGYLFNLGDYYSLKVYTCYNENSANYALDVYKSKGLDAFIEVKDIGR